MLKNQHSKPLTLSELIGIRNHLVLRLDVAREVLEITVPSRDVELSRPYVRDFLLLEAKMRAVQRAINRRAEGESYPHIEWLLLPYQFTSLKRLVDEWNLKVRIMGLEKAKASTA